MLLINVIIKFNMKIDNKIIEILINFRKIYIKKMKEIKSKKMNFNIKIQIMIKKQMIFVIKIIKIQIKIMRIKIKIMKKKL